MKKYNLNKIIKVFLIITICIFEKSSIGNANPINEIIITGNNRLSYETVLMFSGLKKGTDIKSKDLNIALKKLYKTNYFKNIKFLIEDDTIEIVIIENPIIQSVIINGVKNKALVKQLKEITKKSEKYPFLNSDVKQQKNLLLNLVRTNGYYFSELETKIVDNKNNSVDLIYDFNLNDKAIIKKINFQGIKIFKDSKLRNIIKSEEGKFWKFLTNDKYLDEKRIKYDEQQLTNYYKNKGYFQAKIKSSYAKNVNNKYFELIYIIDAGEKFYFKNLSLKLNDNFDNINFSSIENDLKKLKGKKYSSKKLNNILDELNNIALQKEFIFVDVKYDLTISEKNKINIDFKFKDLDRLFVEQINIYGNYLTEEKVVRNSFIVDEGDAFNKYLFDKSISNIKSLRIFKNIKTDIKTSSIDNKKKIIDIYVEESPTGEIFAGAGTGTSGATITAGIKENNYGGRGISLSTIATLSETEVKGRFSVVNPNYKNTDRSLNTVLESTTSDFLSTSGFKTSRTGFSIGTGFEQYNDFFVNLDISTYYEKLETSSAASAHKKKQEGDYLENLLSYKLTLNKLDQNYQPTDGYRVRFEQELPIYSDDLSVSNTLDYSKYYSITDNLILSGKFYFKAVNSIDDDVRVSRRVYIPSSKLRGFEAGKFGPIDGDEYVGGNYGSAINFNSTLPNFFQENENIDINLFLDAATIREVDYDSSLESSEVRSSTGLSVNWYTVIGPLSISYAIPITSESTDKTESFRFRIGTSF